ncbi:MAG: hemolysin family protein [Paludibacteraceae bacterium]
MEIVILSILILFNGFFSLSEIAIVSSKTTRLEQYRNSGSKGAAIALKLRSNSEMFLSAVQVGITLISLITGAYSGVSLAENVTPHLEQFDAIRPYANIISIVVIMFLITYFSIVIGELVPKTIALGNPEKVAIRVAPLINFFSKLFYPFVKLLSASTKLITTSFGIQKQSEHMTESELRQMIKTASLEGVIEEGQNDIHEKVFNFSDKRARHLMTHRIEVEWVDLDESEEEIRKDIDNSQHSKIVCCRETLDNLAGVLMIRDYYKAVLERKDFRVADLLVQPVVIHEKTAAPKVLKMLKQNSSHFCVVVDEYGDFQGIVTFHDIMENLVGLIPDEGEIEEPDYFVREDKSVLMNGDAPIEVLSDVISELDVDFELIDYATVAGFIIDQINEIPKVGDKIEYLDYTFEVVDMDGNRIDKILISKKKDQKEI